MRRTAVLVLLAALVVSCAEDYADLYEPAPTTTAAVTTTLSAAERRERAAARAETQRLMKEMNRTPSASLAGSPNADERDFDNCLLFNETILAVMDDYYSGETNAHTALGSARVALETMKGLDCGRFSAVVAEEMRTMDQALRSVGY